MEDMRVDALATELQNSAAPPEFYIPATSSLQERRPRTLKHGDSFAVFNNQGDCTGGDRSPEGLFHKDTRYLSHLEVTINGRRPLLLSSAVRDDNAVLVSDLTNPDFHADGHLDLPRDTIHVTRTKFLWQASSYERIAIRNFDERTHRITIGIAFAADFADLFEVRGQIRPRRGEYLEPEPSADGIVLGYVGLDRNTRRTSIRFDPAPAEITSGSARFEVELAPHQQTVILMAVGCGDTPVRENRCKRFLSLMRDARRALRRSVSRAATVQTSNSIFNEGIKRSVADLYMLMTDTPQGPYPYAGIPWYSTAFGRDAILTAAQMLWVDPAIAKGVLRFLAAHQATEVDPNVDAEPGKILHEARGGEMAILGEVPFGLYYGTIDATPLFVMLAGAYFERTLDLETIRELWPNIEAALGWIDTHGDIDGDGFVEYARKKETGLINQGWKDSHDCIFHADGRLAEGPIALCEVQAYVYDAKRAAAAMARAMGRPDRADILDREAATLKQRFNERFWCEDLGLYALALDGSKTPCRVRSSNAGHALLCGIADRHHADRVATALSGGEFFSGWGVRTIASSERRYNPMSYHNGSVWPHDNALIALGLARYGRKEEVLRIFSGLFDASIYMDLRRLPELFCGFPRRRRKGPTFYPVACSPQAWAGATPFALLQASLGIEFAPGTGQIRFDKPMLPAFLDEVFLHGLSLGEAKIDVRLNRHDNGVSVTVLNRTGDVEVVTIN